MANPNKSDPAGDAQMLLLLQSVIRANDAIIQAGVKALEDALESYREADRCERLAREQERRHRELMNRMEVPMIDEKRLFNGMGEEFLDELDGWARGMGDFTVSGQDAKELLRLARMGLEAECAKSHPPQVAAKHNWIVPLDMIPTPRQIALAKWAEEHGVPALRLCRASADSWASRVAHKALAALPGDRDVTPPSDRNS